MAIVPKKIAKLSGLSGLGYSNGIDLPRVPFRFF